MIGFWKPGETNGYLSNWYHCQVAYKGKSFNTTEQAFMWAKAKLFKDDDMASQVENITNPKDVKALGRKIRNFDQKTWDENKERLMFEVNLCKFEQNQTLKNRLLQTGDDLLVECSPLDNIWGAGLDENEARNIKQENWPGENLLGKSLMLVRSILKNKRLI